MTDEQRRHFPHTRFRSSSNRSDWKLVAKKGSECTKRHESEQTQCCANLRFILVSLQFNLVLVNFPILLPFRQRASLNLWDVDAANWNQLEA